VVTEPTLIERLSADLEPVRPPAPVAFDALRWLVGSFALVTLLLVFVQPLRPGFAGQIVGSARFAAEVAAALAGCVLLAISTLQLAIPGPGSIARRALPGAALLALWGAALWYGIGDPSLEPSMLGKRPGCNWQTFAFGAAPVGLGVWLLRRRLPLARSWTGALLGLAAGAVSAQLMQLACMYDPGHALAHHLAPGLAVTALGAAAGALWFRRV
jgi:hypothetical protein